MFFVLTLTGAKLIHENLNVSVMVVIRSFFGILFLLPVMIPQGKRTFKTRNMKMMVIRGLLGAAALWTTYIAYRLLPLGLATSIGFTQPLILSVMAIFLLGESVPFSRWISLAIGYTGVLFFVSPWGADFDMNVLYALAANILASLVIIFTKRLSKTDQTSTILFYSFAITFCISGSVSLFDWQTPSGTDWLILLGMGLCGTLSQVSYINALSHASVAFIAPFEYLRLVAAVPIGYYFFFEPLSLKVMIGAALIVGVNIYMARQQV